ncbi:MAG: HNH endonuclease [Flavobacteriaceae bacterium]|nr:HNH endonuclease [Flavobacteriaceae bacterium]
MDSNKFKDWLALENRSKKTIQNRVSNARKVEYYEGDLDEHYEKDSGMFLLKILSYSRKDELERIPKKHKIPIDGVIITGTSTLKNSVKLYMDFRLSTDTSDIKKLKTQLNEIESNSQLTSEEKKILIKYRLGQSFFRKQLIRYWGGNCSVSKFSKTEILIASHIKPYSKCNDEEKYDIYNGLLLTSNYDKLFDNFLISFNNKGEIIISDSLSDEELKTLNISRFDFISIKKEHEKYLDFHRKKFEKINIKN